MAVSWDDDSRNPEGSMDALHHRAARQWESSRWSSQDNYTAGESTKFTLPPEWWWIGATGDGELLQFLTNYQTKLNAADSPQEEMDIARTFLRDLNATSWWQKSTQGWRAAEELRLTDLGTWEQIKEINIDDAHRFASQLGYSLTDDQADDLAVRMYEEGLSDAEIERDILNTTYYDLLEEGQITTSQRPDRGSVRDVRDDLQWRADQWLTVFDKGTLDRMAHDYKSEKITEEQMYQTIVDQSYSQHEWLDPDFVNNLFQRGLTLSDHLAPMKREVANVWGMNMDEVSLDDPFFNESLVTTNDKGVSRFINSREAKALAYKDPRYRKTTEYRGKMNDFASAMAEFFGVRSWR